MTLVEVLIVMVILSIVSAMLITVWFGLQSSYAHTTRADDARSSARDALNRTSTQIRTAQPPSFLMAGQAVFTSAGPWAIEFFSSYNIQGQASDGSGIDSLRLTRIHLDADGSGPYGTLRLVKDSNNNHAIDPGDQSIVLATNVVNDTAKMSHTPVFTYFYRDAEGNLQSANTVGTTSLASVIAVRVRVMVDANLDRPPVPADLQTIVRPQNAPHN